MNPFDLTGPPFLLFYALLMTVVLVVARLATARDESGDPRPVDTSDPYLLAHLCGGANHALSVAVVALVDRKLLRAAADDTLAAEPGAADIARRPIEKALLAHFAWPAPGRSVFTDATLRAAAQAYEDHLRRLDLLPSDAARQRRARRFLIAAGIFLVVSIVKLVLAYQRGRHNVIFLILFTIAAIGGAWVATHPRLTGMGKRLLSDLRVLFDGVKARATAIVPGGGSIELPILAAVYGLSALPDQSFAYVKKLFPKASSGGDGAVVGCGSSSCGSSGCGGGGGGGCGGCGS